MSFPPHFLMLVALERKKTDHKEHVYLSSHDLSFYSLLYIHQSV